jgi:hypothetical protein
MADTDTPTSRTRVPDCVHLRVPRGMSRAVELLARERNCSSAHYMREVLLRGLEADGVRIRDGYIERRA